MDKVISTEPLQGEGRWITEVIYEAALDGSRYIVWEDADGDEKFIGEVQ